MVEHHLDTVGVGGSKPPPRTIFSPDFQREMRGELISVTAHQTLESEPAFQPHRPAGREVLIWIAPQFLWILRNWLKFLSRRGYPHFFSNGTRDLSNKLPKNPRDTLIHCGFNTTRLKAAGLSDTRPIPGTVPVTPLASQRSSDRVRRPRVGK